MRPLNSVSRLAAALAASALAVVGLAPVASGVGDVPLCQGMPATIVGTEGADRIVGTNKADVIVALGGDDIIVGGNGDDVICAGSGDDQVDGGNGRDRLFGEDGDDRLTGANGEDALDGGRGADWLGGNNGTDELVGGPGADEGHGGIGKDVCSAEVTSGCETLVPADEEIAAALTVLERCSSSLVLDVTASAAVAWDGEEIDYDVTVRNDPLGPCLATGAAATTVSGELRLDSTLGSDVTVEDLLVWLELPSAAGTRLVLPASAGLTTDGSTAPTGCPGMSADGCGSTTGAVVGYSSFPSGTELTLPTGGSVEIPFRYFPELEPGDLAALQAADADATLAFATSTSSGETVITRTSVVFDEAPASGTVSVDATVPSGTLTAEVPSVGAGEQTTAIGLVTVVVQPTDPDLIEATFTARTASATSEPVTVETIVVTDPDGVPVLQPAVWPTNATAGVPTEFVVSVAPAGEVESGLTLAWPGGEVEAGDDGTGGDAVADDGVWTARLAWTPTDPGPASIQARANVGGVAVAGSIDVIVLPEGIASGPEALGELTVLSSGGEQFLADRLVLVTEPTADPLAVVEAAELAGGVIVGTSGPGVWQVAVPVVADRTALDVLLEAASGSPVVIGAQPSFVGDLDDFTAVEPSDELVGLQTNLSRFRVDQAWVFQRGVPRSVLVAIIDSGVNLDHPDLDDKIVPGTDIRDGDDDPNDDACLHGTHVAGIVGAETDNGIGVAGVNWGARILPVKVFHPTAGGCGQFRYDDIAAAIDYSSAQGATVMNMSLSGPSRSEDVAKALDRALDANRIVVATAGNTNAEERRYPSGFNRTERFTSWFGLNERFYDIDILSVANVTNDRERASTSTWGPWVDVAAPGEVVMSTYSDTTQYRTLSGTSMAAPFVSGVVSLMRAGDPEIGPAEARYLLQSTGRRAEGLGYIVDAYEAVANGSFEGGHLTWRAEGTVTTPTRLGPIRPIIGSRMLALSSGPDAAQTQATLRRYLRVPSGALTDNELTVSLYFNYVSEEYPEFVNGGFNDAFTVELVLPDGSREVLVDESVDTTAWTPVSGIDFPGGDSTAGQSGWRFATVSIPAERLGGLSWVEMLVMDRGDAIYDSVGLIDGLRVS